MGARNNVLSVLSTSTGIVMPSSRTCSAPMNFFFGTRCLRKTDGSGNGGFEGGRRKSRCSRGRELRMLEQRWTVAKNLLDALLVRGTPWRSIDKRGDKPLEPARFRRSLRDEGTYA